MLGKETDPIKLGTAPTGRELFTDLVRQAKGYPNDAVADAAANLLINVIRQSCPTRTKALAQLEELLSKSRILLADHYDSVGRKKGIFPYPQVIDMPFTNFKDRFGGK